MLKNSLLSKLIILFFALPALACALTGGEEPTATPSPAPTSAGEATAEATTPPATPTVEAVPTVDLTADFISYTSTETGITVQYPSDWAVQDFFVLVLATDETLFDAPGAIQEGVGMVFSSGPLDEFDSTDPGAILTAAVEEFDLSDDAEIVEGPTAVTVNGLPGATARIEGTPEATGIPLVGLAVVVVNGDQVGVGLGITTQTDQEQYLPTIEAVLNTIELGDLVEATGGDTTDLPTHADATEIFVGDKVDGIFDDNGKRDFVFAGNAGETVTFLVEPTNEELDLVVEIFGDEGNSLLREDRGFIGEEERTIFTFPDDGDYFIRVIDYYSNAGGFTISLNPGAIEGTVDPNAGTLEPNVLLEESLSGEPKQYAFHALADQTVAIFLVPEEDRDLTLAILNSDGSTAVEKVDNGFPGEAEVLTFEPETEGDYYLVVEGFSVSEGNFSLLLLDPETAYTAEGTIESDGSQDIRVCIPAGASLAVVVLPEEGFDLVIDVKDGNGENIIDQVDQTASGDPEAVIVNEGINSEADYPLIVSISGWSGQSGTFSIFISSTSERNVGVDGC